MLLAAGFFDAGFGRFLTTPAAGGVAVLVGGVLAYIAASAKTATDRDLAAKSLTHEERRAAYFACVDVLDPLYEQLMRRLAWEGRYFAPWLFLLADEDYKVEDDQAARVKAEKRAVSVVEAMARVAPFEVADATFDFYDTVREVALAAPCGRRETRHPRDVGVPQSMPGRALALVGLAVLWLKGVFALLRLRGALFFVERQWDRAWRIDLGLEPKLAPLWWRRVRRAYRAVRWLLVNGVVTAVAITLLSNAGLLPASEELGKTGEFVDSITQAAESVFALLLQLLGQLWRNLLEVL